MLESVDGRLQALDDRLGLSPEARLRVNVAAPTASKLASFLDYEERTT